MDSNEQDKKQFNWTIKILLLLSVAAGILYFWWTHFRESPLPKFSKQDLANMYGVDKKTFNKWIPFCEDSTTILPNYAKRKLLNIGEVIYIVFHLGDPSDSSVMTKKELIAAGEGTHKTLRGSVKKYPEKFGLTYEQFKQLKKFPPKIAQKIQEQYS